MKKSVLRFGLISGLIVISFMAVTVTLHMCNDNFGESPLGFIIGYGSMLLAFAFIFVGIKNYRDKHNNGAVSFGKALSIGLLITLIASTFYVVAWLISFYGFFPDFMDKYVAQTLQHMADNGATPQEIADKTEEMSTYVNLYKSPFGVAALTYMEILPVGLLMSLLAALILKRKPKPQMAEL